MKSHLVFENSTQNFSCEPKFDRDLTSKLQQGISDTSFMDYLWRRCLPSSPKRHKSRWVTRAGESQDQGSSKIRWVTRAGESQDHVSHKVRWVTSLGELQDRGSHKIRWFANLSESQDQGSHKTRCITSLIESQDQGVTRTGALWV